MWTSSRWHPVEKLDDILPKAWYQLLFREFLIRKNDSCTTLSAGSHSARGNASGTAYRAYRRKRMFAREIFVQNVESTFPRDSRSLPTACRPWMSEPTARITNIAIASTAARGSRGSRHLSHWRDFSDVFPPRAREVLYTYALRHVSLDEVAMDYLGRSLSRSSSPATMCDFSTGRIVRQQHWNLSPGKYLLSFYRGVQGALESMVCILVSKSYIPCLFY